MTQSHDPYAAGGADDVYIAPPTEQGDDWDFAEAPGWPKVVGIISIILGALGLVCGGAGIVWMAVGPGMMQGSAQNMQGGMPPVLLQMNVPVLALTAVGTAWSILLVVAGAMCAGRKPMARSLHLLWALGTVVLTIVNTKFQLDIQADIAEWIKDNPNSDFAQYAQRGGGGMVGLAIGLFIGLAWPVFCLIWFGFVKTKPEQMTGGVIEPAA